MRENGTITQIEESRVWVSVKPGKDCEGCNICTVFASKNDYKIPARGIPGLSVGDKVEIEVRPQKVVSSAFLLFIMPILSMFLGYFLGSEFFYRYFPETEQEITGIITGLIFFGLWMVLLYFYDRKTKSPDKYDVSVISVVESSINDCSTE